MNEFSNYKHPKPSRIEKFLWWCCGADEQILQQSTYADYAKYSGLGGIVLGTGILAFLGMSFAMYRIFMQDDSDSTTIMISALVVGIIWGLLIFNLDRFVVSSTGKGDGKNTISRSEFIGAVPRLIMAALIGVTVSGPLEVYIFQKEIDKQWEVKKLELKQQAQANADTIRANDYLEIENMINKIDEDIQVKNKQIADYQVIIQAETDKVNCGVKCREFKKQQKGLEDQKTVLEKKIEALRAQQKIIKEERASIVAEIDKKNAGKLGMLDSLTTLHDYEGSFFPVWLVRLLFVFIEVAPVFFKLMIAYSPYDYLSENTNRIIMAQQGIEYNPAFTELENGKALDQVIYHRPERLMHDLKAKDDADKAIFEKIAGEYKTTEIANVEKNPKNYIKDLNENKQEEEA